MPTPPPPTEHRFKPGISGNPAGRPKGSLSLTSRLRSALTAGDGERAERLIQSLLDGATTPGPGQSRLLKLIFDRVDGTVMSHIRVSAEKAANEAVGRALEDLLDVAERVVPREHFEELLAVLTKEFGDYRVRIDVG